MAKYYYILIYFWFFFLTIVTAGAYFEQLARLSLRQLFVKVFEDEDGNCDNWTERPPTKEELEKTDLPFNQMLVFQEKVYSIKEGKFVDIWVTCLIQQGDKNSLLKKGIYFNVSTTPKPSIIIRASQLQGSKVPEYSGDPEGLARRSGFFYITYGLNNIRPASVSVAIWNIGNGVMDEKARNEMLDYINYAQLNIINLNNPQFSFYDSNDQESVDLFFSKTVSIAKQFIAIFVMNEKDWDPSRKLE
uniref:Uncharacterized protein n=1 Tax=Phalansterium sp. PJK-2012 TaxID=1267188 RepID=T1QE22_9EUKA|nr:hypothetical protein [Phalansterium sp. PJK-2012]